VGVPLNYRYTASEIDRALAVSQASALIAHGGRERDLPGSRQVAELPRGLILYEAEAGRHPGLQDLIARSPAQRELPVPKASDPAFIFFTSGSTGPAKGVTHSREGVGWMFATYAAALELTADDVMLPGSSISHIGSFGFSFGALAAGARTLVAHGFDSQHMLELLRAQRPTVLWIQPMMLFQLVRDASARREDFRSLRLCRSGSDKVPAELARAFADLTGMVISEGMGMTEVGVVTATPSSARIKVGTIGQAAPGVRLSIRDEAGLELPAGAEGRLWISARGLATGYWSDPVATAAVMRDGWFDSGDVMKADEEGYLAFCGRKKQLIVHDGSNISPQEVEDALLQHEAVALAGVVGVPDLVHGENVHAYVALKPSAPVPTEQELIGFARARIGYKAPERVEFLTEMPLNAGKIDRAALKALAAKREAMAPR